LKDLFYVKGIRNTSGSKIFDHFIPDFDSTIVLRMKAAGANYEDKEVIVDGNLITSRQPSDLPAFMKEIMKKIAFLMASASRGKLTGELAPPLPVFGLTVGA
jgi:putative intracellular protease/amidase